MASSYRALHGVDIRREDSARAAGRRAGATERCHLKKMKISLWRHGVRWCLFTRDCDLSTIFSSVWSLWSFPRRPIGSGKFENLGSFGKKTNSGKKIVSFRNFLNSYRSRASRIPFRRTGTATRTATCGTSSGARTGMGRAGAWATAEKIRMILQNM